MKANELMIGDWVEWDGKPHQIKIVYPYTVDKEEVMAVDVSLGEIQDHDTGVYYDNLIIKDCNRLENIHPIPITEAILAKNGFQRMEYTDPWNGKIHVQYMLEIGDMDSVIYVPDSHCLFAKHMLGERFEIDNVKSVHEMQHALRIGEFNHININL